MSVFCSSLSAVRDDLFLKVNVERVKEVVGTKYDGIPVEDIVALAEARCEFLGVNALVPDDKYGAIAVLEGIHGYPRR